MVAAGDVAVEEEASRIVYESVGRFGPIRVLVNNAGVYGHGDVLSTPIEEWDRIFAIDLRAVYMLTKRVVPEMESAGGGVIVNVSSTLGVRPMPNTLAYSTAKAALNMFTKCCALDLAARKIRVNTVSPAVVETPIHDPLRANVDRAQWEKSMAALHPMGRIGRPDEIARAILYLASDDAAWVTGENLCVDGGMALH
jgi:3-oxoacyl-[acyl-carrier protein] reductase